MTIVVNDVETFAATAGIYKKVTIIYNVEKFMDESALLGEDAFARKFLLDYNKALDYYLSTQPQKPLQMAVSIAEAVNFLEN